MHREKQHSGMERQFSMQVGKLLNSFKKDATLILDVLSYRGRYFYDEYPPCKEFEEIMYRGTISVPLSYTKIKEVKRAALGYVLRSQKYVFDKIRIGEVGGRENGYVIEFVSKNKVVNYLKIPFETVEDTSLVVMNRLLFDRLSPMLPMEVNLHIVDLLLIVDKTPREYLLSIGKNAVIEDDEPVVADTPLVAVIPLSNTVKMYLYRDIFFKNLIGETILSSDTKVAFRINLGDDGDLVVVIPEIDIFREEIAKFVIKTMVKKGVDPTVIPSILEKFRNKLLFLCGALKVYLKEQEHSRI